MRSTHIDVQSANAEVNALSTGFLLAREYQGQRRYGNNCK